MKNFRILICAVGCYCLVVSSMSVWGQTPKNKPDVLYKKDKTTLEVLVDEVSDTDVMYRKVGNPTGPLYAIPRAELQKIVYQNGDVEPFNETKPAKSNTVVVASKGEQKAKVAPTPQVTAENSPKRGLYFTITYGLTASTISVPEGGTTPNLKFDQTAGFTLGYSKKLNLQLDVLLAGTGYKTENEIPSLGKATSNSMFYRLLVPVLAGVHLGKQQGVYLQGGGFASYLLSGKQTVDIPGQALQKQDLKFTADTPGRLEYGAVASIGYASYNAKKRRNFVEARWYHGLGNDTGLTEGGGFLRMATLCLGYSF